MSDEQRRREEEVFGQELALDDLNAAGGRGDHQTYKKYEADLSNCVNHDCRTIYGGGGFPNCAATVEDGSWCGTNDACYDSAVDYKGMTDCAKAWR